MSASWADEPDPLISPKESQEEYCLISPEGFDLLAPSMPAGDSSLVVPQICRRTLGGHQFMTPAARTQNCTTGPKGLAH